MVRCALIFQADAYFPITLQIEMLIAVDVDRHFVDNRQLL